MKSKFQIKIDEQSLEVEGSEDLIKYSAGLFLEILGKSTKIDKIGATETEEGSLVPVPQQEEIKIDAAPKKFAHPISGRTWCKHTFFRLLESLQREMGDKPIGYDQITKAVLSETPNIGLSLISSHLHQLKMAKKIYSVKRGFYKIYPDETCDFTRSATIFEIAKELILEKKCPVIFKEILQQYIFEGHLKCEVGTGTYEAAVMRLRYSLSYLVRKGFLIHIGRKYDYIAPT